MKAALFGKQGSGRKTLVAALQGGREVVMSPGKKVSVTVPVPDARVNRLSEMFSPKKTTWSTVELSLEDHPSGDLAKILQAVRNYDVLVQVVAGYDKPGDWAASVQNDLNATAGEMVLGDHLVIEKRLSGMRKTGQKGPERDLFESLITTLEAGKPLSSMELSEGDKASLEVFSFLTLKKLITVVNLSEEQIAAPGTATAVGALEASGFSVLPLCAPLEAEVATLPEEEQKAFLVELGMEDTASARLLRRIYSALNLISFLTVGPDEVRSWAVASGASAPKAAGKIHGDLERGFIRAEIVSYEDFIAAGSMAAAKRAGTFRTEGKTYIVKDGDIVNILFNV